VTARILGRSLARHLPRAGHEVSLAVVPTQVRLVTSIALVAVLGACSETDARQPLTQAARFIPPDQFLVDKETDLAAIVKVKRTESRWVILPDGDHFPLVVAECEMEELLSGSKAWPVGTTQSVVQYDYSDLIFDRIAPPVIDGRRYILWALTTPKEGEVPAIAGWTAHPQGFLQVRGKDDGAFIFWNRKSHSVTAIHEALASGRRLPLDQIVDPVQRLRVAEERMRRGNLGDEKAFIQGLLVNVLDPVGQAKKVEQAPKTGTSTDMFGMNQGEGQPHALWYKSLALLRDLGADEKSRKSVVTALTPVAQTARPAIRLAAALALVDLGSDAGREALLRGFETDSGPVSSDPPDQMTFPGRYPYDESSTTACAYALARLGDRRGLKHAKVDVRLAAAEALKDQPDAELRKMLEALSAELQPQVEKLKAGGELTKARRSGDYTNRYPEQWVRTQRLLARIGDDRALGRLVEAYILDAGTYPKEEAPLMPSGRPVSWSSGPSPAQAIRGANESQVVVLDRLRKVFGRDPRWNEAPLKELRASLETPPTEESSKPAQRKPTEAEVAKLISDPDPNRRAEGLAAAGYHQLERFHAKVLDTAQNGKGVERNAAVYALGFYGRDVPEGTLRQLMAIDDIELRFSAIELATRRNPARFAQETMDLVRAKVAQAAKARSDDWETQRSLAYLPRIVCRLARGPLPQPLLDGLKDPNPAVRRIVVQALELSGNPDATPGIEPLTRDPDASTREASHAALLFLGPAKQ
jgi:HEAT repeat protein